jgi:DNA-binding response OmpR family regulator
MTTASPPRPQSAAPTAASKFHVLIIEDDLHITRLLEENLKRAGFLTAPNEQALLDLRLSSRWSLILCCLI